MDGKRRKPSKKKPRSKDTVEVRPGFFLLERMSDDLRKVVDVEMLPFDGIGAFICSGGWTATVFEGKSHKKADFLQHSGLLVLDFDEGLTLDAAKARFAPYRHIIGLTKSHQSIKNPGTGSEKPACDRFRVLLFSERAAGSAEELEQANKDVFKWNPEADKSGRHAAKVWSPCTKIVASVSTGLLIPMSAPVAVPKVVVPVKGTGAPVGSPVASTKIDDTPGDLRRRAAIGFLKATRPSVSGDYGHNKLFRAASALVWEFKVKKEEAIELLCTIFNPRCTALDGTPNPWSRREIEHKVTQALKSTKHIFGYGVNKDWDVRWRCCPELVELQDLIEAGGRIELSRYAPGIEEHARAALARRKLFRKIGTGKKRVDLQWTGWVSSFLEGAPRTEFTGEDLLRDAIGVVSPSRGDRTRLGRALGALGWKSKRVKGKQVYFFPTGSSGF